MGESLAVALLDLHCCSSHSRLIDARPPKPLLAPDKDMALATLGLERLFDALSERHRYASPQPSTNGLVHVLSRAERREACKDWIVTESMVWVVPKADPSQTAKDKLEVKKKGDVVKGELKHVDNYEWLRVDDEKTESWILIDGSAAGVDRKFLAPIFETEVLRRRVMAVKHDPHVYIRDATRKDATALGIRKKGEKVLVMDIRGDGWVQLDPCELTKIRKQVNEAFMMADGKPVGLGQLLEPTGESKDLHAAAYSMGDVPPALAPWVENVEKGSYPPC